MTHPNGRVSLSDFGRVKRVLSDIRAALDQGIDALIRSRHRDDFCVLPCEARTSKSPEHVIPDSQLGGILSREPFPFDIVNALYGGVLAHEQPHQEGRTPHH